MKGNTQPAKPAELEALFAKSMTALRNREFERAMRFGDQLLTLSNHAPSAIVWAVRLRLEAHQWQAAIDIGTPLIDQAPEASGLVGHAYENLGDLDKALLYYQKAREGQPDNPSWHYHEASALSRLYRDFESMERLRQAVKLAPDPGALLVLAGQELTFSHPEAGLRACDKAVRMNPAQEGAHVLAAKCLMATRRLPEADRRWSAAIAMRPADLSLPLERAMALTRHGEFEVGIAALEDILQGNPDYVPALVQIASAKRITQEDERFVAKMESLVKTANEDTEDPIALHFALGKSYDNLGQYEEAMSHFDDANRLRYRAIEKTGGFDREGYVANMALRAHVYRKEVVESEKRNGNSTEVPIFILGMVRSGTTLAEQILSAHPDVAGAGEQDFWINTDLRLMDYAARTLNKEALQVASEIYLRLIEGFAKGAPRVIDKQPGNMILAGALHIAYPNARILYMRRFPADNAVSIWTTNIRTSTRFVNDKSNIVHAYRQHETLREHWNSVIPADRYLEVSYEDLVTNQEVVSRQMVDFCGLPWNNACLTPEGNKRQVITPSLWQVRQPVYRSSIDRWRRYEPWLGEFRKLLEDY